MVDTGTVASFRQPSGDYEFSDVSSIEFAAGTVLDAGAGAIHFNSPSVTIGERAKLTTSGSITITASKTFPSLGPLFNVWSQISTIVQNIGETNAHVTVCKDAEVNAGSVSIDAHAGDDLYALNVLSFSGESTPAVPLLGQVAFKLLADVIKNDIYALPLSAQVKQPQATITIATGAAIKTSSGDVTISAAATADARGQAIYSVLANDLAPNLGGGAAAGFSYVDASTTVSIAGRIHSSGAATITSTTTAIAEMKSRVTLNQGLQKTNPGNLEVAYAGSHLQSTSRITVAADGTIEAGENVAITSEVDDSNSIKANTASYRDGLVGVTIGTGWSYGTSEVIVDGTIRAGKVDMPRAVTFDPTFALEPASGTLLLTAPTDFHTGDEIRYAVGSGHAIPGLVDSRSYYAIVDPRDARRLRLADSVANALANRPIPLGTLPTLTTAKGTLSITAVDAAAGNTIRFGVTAWPDGSPLFTSGQTVRYAPAAGQFLGFNAADGTLSGPIPAGDYVVRVVPLSADEPGMAIQLLDVGQPVEGGRAIDLNDNPNFRLADGSVLQIFSFDADSGQISLDFPRQGSGEGEVPFPTPRQTVNLVNGQPVTYAEAFGTHVPGLEDGRTYFAIVDPATPGILRLALTAAQAASADPVIQRAVPKIETLTGRTLDIGNVEPGTGLVFAADPGLAAGAPVIFHAAPGKPVGGLVDGKTYYAYPQVNPFFEPEWPRYVIGLRTAAVDALDLIDFSLEQTLAADGVGYAITGVDSTSGSMAIALPTAAVAPVVDGSGLVGGTGSVIAIPVGSRQVWTTAAGGTFKISIPSGDSEVTTPPIAFDAPATAVMGAINRLTIPGVSVTAAIGRGTPSSPWTLVGTRLEGMRFDSADLTIGAAFNRATAEDLQAVSSAASGGSFRLAFAASGPPLTTESIPFDAPAAAVRTAINAIPGLLTAAVEGTGSATDPWLISTRLQPIRTGQPLVFRDAWGSTSHGLVDGQTVYAVVLPESAQGKAGSLIVSLAATLADALAAKPVILPFDAMVEFGSPQMVAMSGTAHTLASTLDASGISLKAVLTSGDQQSLKAANGSEPKLKDVLTRYDTDYGDSKTASNIFGYFKRGAAGDSEVSKLINKQANGSVNEWFTLSGSGAGLTVANTARVVLGSSATLATSGKVSLASSITEKVKSNVEATISKPNKGKLAVALAIDVVDVSNTARTIVGANASVTGGEGVAVDSKVVYPWAFQSSWLGNKWAENLGWDTINTLAKAVGGKFGVDEWFVNHWANAGVKQNNFNDKQLKATITASLAVVTFTNEATARIEDGAQINKDAAGIAMPAGTPVTVTASTDIAQTGFAGLVYVDLSPDNIVKKLRRGDKTTNSLLVAAQGETSIGGSVGVFTVDNTTQAYVGGLETETVNGVTRPIRTPNGPLRLATGSGPLNVAATNSLLIVQLGQGGGDASSFGFSGTAAVVDVKRQTADAAILGGSDPSRAAVIDAGRVDVNATDTSYVIPIAGAVMVSKNKAVGVSTALALVNRDVAARVGSRDDETTNVGWIDSLTAAGNVALTARAAGAVTPSALAAAKGSSVKAAGAAENNPAEQPVGAGGAVAGKFGLAVSGDYVRAHVTDVVQATVNTRGILAAAGGPRSLSLTATNDTLLQATAGAAAFLSGDGSSLGLAGSAAVTTAASTVTALVRQATVQGFSADLRATNARRIGGLAASGSGATAGNSGTMSLQVVGSVVVNSITATTTARFDTVTGTGLGDLSVAAKADEKIWAAAGSFLFNFSPSGAQPGQTPGKSLGIGASVAVQNVSSITTASLSDSVLEAATAAVRAADTSQLYTFAAGIVGTGSGSSLSGMWTNVTVTPTVTAAIHGGSLDVGGAAGTAGGVDVTAMSMLLLVTAAGDMVIGRSSGSSFVAAGAAVAVVRAKTSTESRLDRSAQVRARRGNVSIASSTRTPEADAAIDAMLADFATPRRASNAIWTFAVGVAGSNSNLSLGFSWAESLLTTDRTAIVTGAAAITADQGNVAIHSADEAGIYSGAGTISVAAGPSAKVSAGAAVTKNAIQATTKARMNGAEVTTLGAGSAVSVTASAAALIGTAAVGGEFTGKAGIGTSLVMNEITQVVDAGIGNTKDPSGRDTRAKVTSAGGLVVIATDRSRIGAGAGQVSAATAGVAAGAAAATNNIRSATSAVIERADVIATGGATVKADAAGEIFSYAVGVSGAFSENNANFAGAGSGTGNTLVRQVLAAVRSEAALDVGGLSVTATDGSRIDTAAGTLAIQYAGKGGISSAMGVSAAKNDIGSQTDATKMSFVRAVIEDSTTTIRGSLDLEAAATLDIQAITAAGAGVFSSGTNWGINVVGAGAGSGNTIQLDVEAAVRQSTVIQPAGGDVAITAANTSSILAVAGGVEVAGSGSGSKGINVTLGAAATVNEVAISTSAVIDAGADVRTTRSATLTALGAAAIKAVSFGVAAAFRGGSAGFDLTGTGSAAINRLDSQTLTAVRGTVGSDTTRAAAVSLTAIDRPAITAGAGGLASVFNFGGNASPALSVGVSSTINDVTGSARAVVDGGTVWSSGDVSIAATFDRGNAKATDGSTIFAVSVAGSADASFGGGGVLFPLAGAGNRNSVTFTTEAAVQRGTVTTGGAVSLHAEDRSRVYSNAGGVGLGLSFGGGSGGGVAIGASVATTTVTNTVRAALDSATVTATGDVGLTASNGGIVDAVGYGVALMVTVAGTGGSAAGSGASVFTTLTNTIAAEVLSSKVESRSGSVSLSATDMPTITARAGAGALAVTIGNGVSLAPGVVTLETSILDTTRARIAAGDQGTAPVVIAAQAVSLTTESQADVSSLGVAVAAAATIGEFGLALAGAGGHSFVMLASTLAADIAAGVVRAGRISLTAIDHDLLTKNTFGSGALSVGLVGGSIGVSLTETTVTNQVTASIGKAHVTATSGGITLDARGGNSLATETVATAAAVTIGGGGAGGHAISTDASTFAASVMAGATLSSTGPLTVRARGASDDAVAPDGSIEAQAHGGSLGIAAVGVVVAKAKDATQRLATIGDGVDLSGVGGLLLSAASNPNVKARSIAVDVGGVAVTVNQSEAEISGAARASTGSSVRLPDGDVAILATGTPRLDVDQRGVVDGAVAAGATQSSGRVALATEAMLGGGAVTSETRTGGIVIQAISRDAAVAVRAVAGSGGLFSGFGTTGDLVDSTTTRASIAGGTIHTDTIDVFADRVGRYGLAVDSTSITVGLGVGITRASFTADRTAADGLDRVQVDVGPQTTIVATGPVGIGAGHRIERVGSGPTVDGIGGSILVSGQQAVSAVTARVPATIAIANDVSITSGTSPLVQPGGITILPQAALAISDATHLANLGLLVSGGRMESFLHATVAPQVTMGDDVRLTSHGRIDVGTTAFVASSTQSNGWGAALFGGIGTYATSNVSVDQAVRIGSGARLSADGSLSVTPGDDPTGASSTQLGLDATARAHAIGLLAIPTGRARSELSHTSELVFGPDANVTSGGSMFLSARALAPTATATGESEVTFGGITKTDVDEETSSPTTSKVTLAGSFVAGRESRVEITIPNDQAGGFTNTVNTNPQKVFGIPLSGAWKYLPDFNPQTFIDQGGVSADVAATLRSGVASASVGAITFAPLDDFQPVPLIVSGGSVTVTGDTIDTSRASLTARTARITIRNESPDYLLLGRMTIANVEGGAINFRDARGTPLADPQTASISRDNAVPEITVEQMYPAGVGGSEFGPAVFLAQQVENLGGDVTIRNVKGSFGQTGTIAAKRITIDTPNGVFAVDTPSADWAAAGVPSAQWADRMLWPGGRPGREQLNGNQAVMYAINAISSGYAKSWGTATSEDELNRLVYGDPGVQDPGTFVFFGGSVPQYENTGNSQGVNQGIAAGARTDGQRSAWKMTDKYPGKQSGWDHAWMPKLQKLPSVFQSNDLPTAGSGTAVRGQVIVINAKTANINGTLEAGGERAGDQSVIVPKVLEATLIDYQRRYRLGEVTVPIYRIPDNQLGKAASADRLIGASFDARTGRILLDEAISSGGGTVSITGRIINTGGPVAGKIKVRGGSGDLVVRNDTHIPVVTSNLQTGGGGKRGVVNITDLNIENPAQQQTSYVYDGTEIRVYRGARGADLSVLGDLSDRLAGWRATFDPRSDARWQWQLHAELKRSVNLNLEKTPYPGVDASGWTFDNADVTYGHPWGPWTTIGRDQIVFESNPSEFVQRLDAFSDATYGSGLWLQTPYSNFDWNTGFSDSHKFWYPGHVSLEMTMSLKADWPIGIDFSGTSFGEIRVTSIGDVTLAGNAVASRIVLASSGGHIAAPAGGGSIQATILEVRADGDIGSSSTPLRIGVESITAASKTGSIWLDGRRSDPDRPLVLDGLTATQGTVRVAAAGNLLAGSAGVTAASAIFESVAGGIGSLAAPLAVAAGQGGTLRFDALAQQDIHVRQSQGDMLVGSVRSSGGSVTLEATGDVFNADTWTITPAAAAARIRQFEALGATNPEAYRADVAAFEGNVTSRYTLYWSVRNDADNLTLWRIRTAASLGIDVPLPGTPTDEQIRGYVAGLRRELEDFFAETIGASWQSLRQFKAFDPTYVYVTNPAQVERFRANRTVTAAQLAIQLAARALDTPPPGEAVTGSVNVAGRNVTLISASGSVGKNDTPVTITSADLAAGHLTDVQRQELALAATPGDARLVRQGDTVTAVILNVRRPLVLDVSGRLDVDAPEGIAVAQKAGDLRVGRIGSRNGLVSVIADGTILNAPDRTIDMWSEPVDFSRPNDWALLGNARQTVSPTGGLSIPAFANSASGTWLGNAVPSQSFRASFTYQGLATSNPDQSGLAFVLAAAPPATTGRSDGFGYNGLAGPKVGLILNPATYQQNPSAPKQSQILFDSVGNWPQKGQFEFVPTSFWNRPAYITLVYDASARKMTITVSDQPDGAGGKSRTRTYDNIDLHDRFGKEMYVGFTSGNSRDAVSHQVTNFAFSTGATIPGERVELPASGTAPWVVLASPTAAAFTFSASPGGPVATFADQTHSAAAAWYPTPVLISRDFSVTFRYRHSTGADGMALVFQNAAAPTTALGAAGGALGYTGIAGPKVGYLINIFGAAGTRFDTTGTTGGYNPVPLLQSDSWVTVTLTYDAEAKLFTERLVAANGISSSKTYEGIDLVTLLGKTTATFGFTAASGWYGAKQEIQSLVFDSPAVPLPIDTSGSRGGWQLNGSVQRLANGMLVIPDRAFTATSTWYERPVATSSFEASFTYEAQGTTPADGLAFVMQRSAAGLTAIGKSGDGLGYIGLAGPKVGLLFNIYDKPGVRFDTGGETGTFESVPWLFGGPITVRIAYNAKAGAFTATLSRTGYAPYTRTWVADFSDILGSQAFIGFTSGTGAMAATQTVRHFQFSDRGGIASDRPAAGVSPTVKLWSSYGNIGLSGDEIAIRGVLEARAPNGSIHTNPPPAPAALPIVSGTLPDGTPVTTKRSMVVPLAAPGNRVEYSTDGGRSWRTKWLATEGLNVVLVAQVDTRGIRSAPHQVRFVLDTKAPPVPLVALRDRDGNVSRTGLLRITAIERNSRVEYSVNGSGWSTEYAPVEGRNVVSVRQIDIAGNVSRASAAIRFTKKSSVQAVDVTLRRDTGLSGTDGITWDGQLSLRAVEKGARVEYSTDGGVTWRRRFTAVLGENRVSVRQVDRVGNISAPTPFAFTLVPRRSQLPGLSRLVGWGR